MLTIMRSTRLDGSVSIAGGTRGGVSVWVMSDALAMEWSQEFARRAPRQRRTDAPAHHGNRHKTRSVNQSLPIIFRNWTWLS
jgi:hypothetical protein